MERPTKRGRPRKYATAKDKATADYQRQRNKRQEAATRDKGLPYSNFHNLHYPVQQLDNPYNSVFTRLQEQDIDNFLPPPSPPLQPTTEGVFPDHDESLRSALIMCLSSAPEADSVDRSLSLLAADPQLPGHIDEQSVPNTGTSIFAEDPVDVPNHQSPEPVQDVVFDTTSESSPQVGNGEPDPIEHLAQELAEQLIKFQGCCNECHQAAKHNHMEDTNEHIGLATYLNFTPSSQ